jgi:LuxR family maltose regulon positive regulatory protein
MRNSLPIVPADAVERRRLLQLLSTYRSMRLIQFIAPAGYGKSTLAAAWIEQLMQLPADRRPVVCWLTFSPEDNALDLAFQHLLDAFHAVAAELRIDELHEDLHRSEHPLHIHLQLLTKRLHVLDRPVLLVFDDCHLADSAATAFARHFLDFAAENVQLLLISRSAPSLDFSDLPPHSRIIATEQLRLDTNEFHEFLRRQQLDHLTEQQCDALEQRAAGWIAGLQMMLHEHHQNGVLDRYIQKSVLRALPTEVLDFLIETSPLPYLTADFCATATMMAPEHCSRLLQTAHVLDSLVGRFVAPATTSESIYRLHPLLQDSLLRSRRTNVRRFSSELALRRRAAEWLTERQEIDTALDLVSGDEECITAIVGSALRNAILRYELTDALRWLSRVPSSTIDSTYSIAIDAAWIAYLRDDVQLRNCIDRVRRIAAIQYRQADAEIEVLDALCTFMEGDSAATRRKIAEAERLLPPGNSLAKGYVALFGGYLPINPENMIANIRSMQQAADIFRDIGFPHGAVEATATQGLVKRRNGDSSGAIASLSYAVSMLQSTGWRRSLYAVDAAEACGETLYFSNRITEARKFWQTAVDVDNEFQASIPSAYQAWIGVQLCDIADGCYRPQDAEDLRRWATISAKTSLVNCSAIAAQRIRRDHRLGLPERCWQTVESLGVAPEDLQPTTPEITWIAVLSGAVLGGARIPNLEHLLITSQDLLETRRSYWQSMRIQVMLVLHALTCHDHKTAAQRLQHLLLVIERHQVPRLILDHTELRPLLHTIDTPYARRLIRTLRSRAAPSQLFNLSATESKVMKLLMQESTTNDIAQHMHISVSTVRGHIKNIFRKLGVHSRTEAVRTMRSILTANSGAREEQHLPQATPLTPERSARRRR